MEKAKLSRKRCSPLPDIYTLFDKTSDYAAGVQSCERSIPIFRAATVILISTRYR